MNRGLSGQDHGDVGDDHETGSDRSGPVLPKSYFKPVNPLITAVIVIGLFVMVQVSSCQSLTTLYSI